MRDEDKTEIATPSTEAEGEMSLADQRKAGFRLLAFFVGALALAGFAGYLPTVLIVLAVIVIIMIHELGHFVTAKLFGMKVTEFFVGFGPRLWSVKRGETEYGIKAIPAGGYNRIIGMSNLEEVDPADEPRAYRQKKYFQKVIVAGAGSFMHAIMAFLLLYSIFTITGTPAASTSVGGFPQPGGPAESAGLVVGDRVVALDTMAISEWDQVRQYVQQRPGQSIDVTVERGGQTLTLPVTPAAVPTADGGQMGVIGVVSQTFSEKTPPLEAVGKTFGLLGRFTVETVKSIGRIFSPSGIESYTNQLATSLEPTPANQPITEIPQERFLSPVGLVSVANNAADSGWRETLLLLFSINIFVGIFNLVPLLPFDGGHIAVATYERLRSWRGKRHTADYAKLLPVSYVVLGLLVVISLTSLWLDIFKPIPNPF